MIENWKNKTFLFNELVKRDFKKKYKRSVLGAFWSILAPLLTLLIMYVIFSNFFQNTIEHYVIFIFTGSILWSYFKDATNEGMYALILNADVLKKINVPKQLFVLSKNCLSFFNFVLTVLVYFLFIIFNGLQISWRYFLLLYPAICMTAFNIGIGMVLSALFVFFVDIKYLYDIATMLLMYGSAIFYDISRFPDQLQVLFYCNPVYVYISYFRIIVLSEGIPNALIHTLCAVYAIVALIVGRELYRKYNYHFVYYL